MWGAGPLILRVTYPLLPAPPTLRSTSDAAVQTEGRAALPQAGAAAAEGAPGGAAPSELLAELQKQLEEKDRTIAELRRQVQELRLAQPRGGGGHGTAQ